MERGSHSNEVVLKTTSFSRKQCFEYYSLVDPFIQELALSEFEPKDYGFEIASMHKGEISFVEVGFEDETLKPTYPTSAKTNNLIIYSPSQVWGYGEKQLILRVVASCHCEPIAWYVWYKDQTIIKEDSRCCCLAVHSPGSYTVEIQYGEDQSRSVQFK